MKFKTNFKKGTRISRPPRTLLIKSLILSALIIAGFQVPLQAQENEIIQPSWWFGAAGGANINFYRGSTQQLNADLTVPTVFHDGFGIGLFLAPHVEFHHPESRWGFILEAAYDNRKGSFEQVTTPCNCPADLDANLSYISFEPSLRFAPFKSDLYLFAGPRFAYNLSKSFTYEQGINPAYPDQVVVPDEEGDFSDIEKYVISMQVGAGYDIHLTSKNKHTQAALSPFVSFQPYFGQDPRSIETWNITTLRAGIALKFGRTHKGPATEIVKASPSVGVIDPAIRFTVYSPRNVAVERRVRETFPISNYVFFDLESTQIPDRYVLLTKNQVKDFSEDRLEVFKPKKLSGRSDREMIVYYNVLNILGDRMGEYPKASVTLTGSSMEGSVDGKEMAESIKNYLVDIFKIDPSRIIIEGRVKPKISSEQPGGTKELTLLREDDHRVSIASATPELLMEYQTGPNVPLRPVEFVTIQPAPLDSYVTFKVDGAKKAFSSWSLEIKDKNGTVQKFGPYTAERVSIPGKTILGAQPQGDYKVTMIGKAKNGKTVTRDATINMVLWTPSEDEMGMRYSVIYEFNDDEVIKSYEKYLTEIVTPQIPQNGKVIIHGYTDIIGDAGNNQRLSLARANDVRDVIEKSLATAGRKDVKFEVYGFGENEKYAPFRNDFPEERFYNRSVIIDIIPPKQVFN